MEVDKEVIDKYKRYANGSMKLSFFRSDGERKCIDEFNASNSGYEASYLRMESKAKADYSSLRINKVKNPKTIINSISKLPGANSYSSTVKDAVEMLSVESNNFSEVREIFKKNFIKESAFISAFILMLLPLSLDMTAPGNLIIGISLYIPFTLLVLSHIYNEYTQRIGLASHVMSHNVNKVVIDFLGKYSEERIYQNVS